MIAAGLAGVAALRKLAHPRRAAELADGDHQCGFEQPALIKIVDERREGPSKIGQSKFLSFAKLS